MKKKIALASILALSLGLMACNQNTETEPQEATETQAQETLEIEETKVFEESQGEVKDLKINGETVEMDDIAITIDGAEIYGSKAFGGNDVPILLFAYQVENNSDVKMDTEATWMSHVRVVQMTDQGEIELVKGRTNQEHEKYGEYFGSQGYHVEPGETLLAGIMYDVEYPEHPVHLQFYNTSGEMVESLTIS